MEGSERILEGHTDAEKGAYLSAIASIATADREASDEEVQYLQTLCNAAGLSDEQREVVETAATETSGQVLQQSLDILKTSDLKYSLVTDLITFAKSDGQYAGAEQTNIQKIGEYLGVDQHQLSLLDQFAQKATDQPEMMQQQGGVQNLLGLGGLQDKMKSAGINTGGLLKGLIAIAAPMLLSRMMSGGFGGRNNSGGGMFGGGGGLGGALSGGMGGLGGGLGGLGGGLGSIIGMLSGGRGMGSTGGLLGRILGGGF